jgi:hypothetical protein
VLYKIWIVLTPEPPFSFGHKECMIYPSLRENMIISGIQLILLAAKEK